MTKKVYRVRNWKDYNKSLIERGSLTFWISDDVLTHWQSKTVGVRARGRSKFYADQYLIMILTLKELFHLTLRSTEGLMRSLLARFNHPAKVPSYTTLCRRSKGISVLLKSRKVSHARHVLIDSTGIQVIGEGEWKRLKHGQTRYQVWRKLHLAIDAENQDILSAVVTDSSYQDGTGLGVLIDDIPGSIRQVTADGAYDKKACYRKAYERQAKPVFPPQHNACVQQTKYHKDPALLQRDQTVVAVGRGANRRERLKRWKVDNCYHQRSLIETAMSRMKFLFGDQMRARHPKNQQTELLIRCHMINRINLLGMPDSSPIEKT